MIKFVLGAWVGFNAGFIVFRTRLLDDALDRAFDWLEERDIPPHHGLGPK